MAPIKPNRLLFPWLFALIFLVGCATGPAPTPPAPQESAAEAAKRLLAAGQPGDAARRLERAGNSTRDAAKADLYRLQAAVFYAEVGRDQRAHALLEVAQEEGLAADTAPLVRLLKVRIAETPPPPETIIARLSPVPEGLDVLMTAAWLTTLADAELATGQSLSAARYRIRVQQLLDATNEQTNQTIWNALRRVPLQTLSSRVPATQPDLFGAWLELAWAVRNNASDADALKAAVTAWLGRYPEHPAARSGFADGLREQRANLLSPPESVALLLPLSGELAGAGKAIRDGFLTGFYAQPADRRPELRILDTQSTPAGAAAAYQHIDAADAIVGPLSKAAVREILARATNGRLLLALNTVADAPNTAAHTYQFGLAPEDDARTAARAAWQAGLERAVLLAPDNDWGDRVAGSYRKAFEAAGGRILEAARYHTEEPDYSKLLQGLFNLDASERRFRAVRKLLRRDLKFTPSRRPDMQAVFMAAFPRQARLLIPQIRFKRGIGLPVYATSHAYPESADKATREDLRDMRIVELPWLLGPMPAGPLRDMQESAKARWPKSMDKAPGLVAFGVDAYRLLAHLGQLRLQPESSLPGATGTLTMSEKGRVQRAPVPVVVTDQGLKRLQPLSSPASSETERPAAPEAPISSTGAPAEQP